jgi:hypothetical protein
MELMKIKAGDLELHDIIGEGQDLCMVVKHWAAGDVLVGVDVSWGRDCVSIEGSRSFEPHELVNVLRSV